MQDINSALAAELAKGQPDPVVLVDLYELYDHDYVPGVGGCNPDDAIEKFAAQEITWNGNAYRRELKSRSDIVRSMGERTNSVTLNFSNISRYMATFAQTQQVEGMLLVVRCVARDVTTDSLVLFVGRCDKPSDIDKREFTLQARQDFGNIYQTVPPDKFQADDPDGRLPSDPLFEGIPFNRIDGSLTFPQVVPSTSFFGRLFGRRTTETRTMQWSSTDSTPLGQIIPECFGRVQMQLIPIAWADKGSHIGALWVACKGPIAGMDNIKSRTEGWGDPSCNLIGAPPGVHLGDAGGTGTNTGNTCQPDLGAGLLLSHTAYVDGASLAPDPEAAVGTRDDIVTVTAIIRGRIVPLPDSSAAYVLEGWTDNPVHIARFILTSAKWVNINSAFMQDDVNYVTAKVCDYPVIDNSNTQVIPVVGPDINQAGTAFTRLLPTGNINPRFIRFYDLGDGSVIPEFEDGPYIPLDPTDPLPDPSDPTDATYISQKPLRKRYTANFPITSEVRAVDLLYKVIFPTAKLFMRVNKFGRYEIRSEQPTDFTNLRSAVAVGDTSISVLDVTPWKTGPDLLRGRILLGFGLTNSEVRTPSAAAFTSDGNAVTLVASASGGGVTATASGATLTGGSSSVQASGTITMGGAPAAGNSVTATINGIAVSYTLEAIDTTGTTAAMLANYINANPRLNKFVRAIWSSASPTVITIVCLFGSLTVPAMLKAHSVGIADPTSAPTVAAASGALAAGTYKVAYSDVTAIGSTALTPVASVVLTANQQINLSSLPALTGASRDFYMSERENSTNLRFITSRANNSNFSINSLPEPGAAVAPSYNTTAEEMLRVAMSFATNSQDIYPAWSPNTTVALNDIYLSTVADGHLKKVTTAGVTGVTEPSWNNGAGATTTSGTAVFTEFGSTVLQQAGLTRANIVKNTFKWPLGSKQSSVNQVKGNFRDAKNDFALTPFKYNDRDHQDKVKKVFPLELDLSAVDSVDQVARIAGWTLSKNREGDWFNALETGPQGLILEEGDLICASDDSGGLINVATRIEDLRIKPNHQVVINQARRYSTLMFSDEVASHRIPLASTLRYVQTNDTLAEFIDTPSTRPADPFTPGFTIAASHDLSVNGDWRGWALWADFGDGYTLLTEGDVPASIGVASTTLGTVTDIVSLDTTNTVTFSFKYEDPFPSLVTCTEADLVANPYRNLLLVGNEYVQAMTVNRSGANITIGNLFRGRFHSDVEGLTHSASERVVLINGAEKFVAMSPDRVGTAFNYKFVTTNQDLADATPISFTWTGQSLRAAPPTDLNAVHDSSEDFFISAVGHPTEAQRPETYVASLTRDSTDAPLRDIPIVPGIRMAAIFGNIIHAEGGASWGTESYATTSQNNITGSTDPTQCYVTQPVTLGTEINARLTMTPPPDPFLSGIIRLGFGPSDFTDPGGSITGIIVSNESNSTTLSHVLVHDWATVQVAELDIPTVDGILFVRVVWSGTEIRWQFSGSPINPSAKADVILKDVPTVGDSTFLRAYLVNGGPDGASAVKIENVTLGGAQLPQTIYTLGQQQEDNSGAGIATGDLRVEMWQVSPLAPNQKGLSVKGTF